MESQAVSDARLLPGIMDILSLSLPFAQSHHPKNTKGIAFGGNQQNFSPESEIPPAHPYGIDGLATLSVVAVEKGAELGSISHQRKRRFDEEVVAISKKKKETHRNHEQRRRDKINEGINQLKELIEPSNDAKYDKATILSKAINFIKHSQKTHRELEERNEALLGENTTLKCRKLESNVSTGFDTTTRLWLGGKELEKENKKLRSDLARLRSEMIQMRNENGRSDSTTNSASSSSDSSCSSPPHKDYRQVPKRWSEQQNTAEQIILTSPDLLCAQPMPLEACTVGSLTTKHERRRSCGDFASGLTK